MGRRVHDKAIPDPGAIRDVHRGGIKGVANAVAEERDQVRVGDKVLRVGAIPEACDAQQVGILAEEVVLVMGHRIDIWF